MDPVNILSKYKQTSQSVRLTEIFPQEAYTSIDIEVWDEICDWLLSVTLLIGVKMKPLVSSLYLFNNFLIHVKLSTREYRLYLAACTHIAISTSYDSHVPYIGEWERKAHYTKNDLNEAIKYVCAVLEGRLRYPSCVDFLDEIKYETNINYPSSDSVAFFLCASHPKYTSWSQVFFTT